MTSIQSVTVTLFILIGIFSALGSVLKDSQSVVINGKTEPLPPFIDINNNTTSVSPNVTSPTTPTTAVPSTSTTPSPITNSTTPVVPTTTSNATTVKPTPTPTSKSTTTTEKPLPTTPTTGAPSTPTPSHRRFDGPSFIGGIVLALGLVAIGFVAFKFYKARTELNYHTL